MALFPVSRTFGFGGIFVSCRGHVSFCDWYVLTTHSEFSLTGVTGFVTLHISGCRMHLRNSAVVISTYFDPDFESAMFSASKMGLKVLLSKNDGRILT